MNFETLRKLQLTELVILKDFDQFCLENNINYSLYAGTALGAIRHKGFIPWDDDIDICMERTQYEKFLDIWEEKGPDGYFLQSERDFDNTRINFSKIRMNGTTLISGNSRDTSPHNGIWIDVFAIDKVPKNKRLRKKLFLWAKIRMVYTRGYAYIDGGKLLEILSKIMLCLPSSLKNKIRAYSSKHVAQYSDMTENYDLMIFSCPENFQYIYPSTITDKYTRIRFEDFDASIIDGMNCMLKIFYGDYMKLPPEKDRVCKHQPLKIAFKDEL